MKAIVINQYGDSNQLIIKEIPTPIAEQDEILIKIEAFGVNRAEVYMRKGLWGDVAKVSGIECVGTIESDPSGKLPKGQVVAAIMGGMGRTRNGSYAEYTTVPSSNIFPIETNLSWEDFAALPESYATAWCCLNENMQIKKNDIIFIRGGTSALGQAAINIASAIDGVTIIASTRSTKNIQLLKQIGCTDVLIESPNLSDEIRGKYPNGIESVMDIVGNTTLLDSLKMVRKGVVCNAGFLEMIIITLVIISVSLMSVPADAATKQITINKSKIEKAINNTLVRVKVHIDNLGARHGGSFLQKNSYLAIKLKGSTELTHRFSVAEESQVINKTGGRYLRFYVSDFNSSSIHSNIESKRNGRFILNINFESNGSEVQGRCVTRRGVVKRKWKECRLDMDRNAQINNAKLKVWAPIIVRGGKLSIGNAKANFSSKISINNRLCKVVKKTCKALEANIRNKIARGVVGTIKKIINGNARTKIESAIQRIDSNLRRTGVKVVKLEDLGNRYRITLKTPDVRVTP